MQKLSQLFNKGAKFLLAALLIIVPLYPKFPFLRIPGTSVAIRLEDFLLLVVAIVTVYKLAPKIKELLNDKFVRAIAIFLGIAFVSFLSAFFVTKTIGFNIGILHVLRRVEYVIPFFAVLAFYKSFSSKDLEFFVKVLMVVTFAAFLYGFGQRYLNFPFIITQNEEYAKGVALRYSPGSHINSTFAGHYDLATFLVMLLPIFISLFFIYKDKLTKIGLFVVILSGLWLLANSASRISVVSYLVASSLALVLIKKYKEVLLVLISGAVILGLSTNLYSRYQRIIDVLLGVKAYDAAEIQTPLPSPTPEPEVFEDRSTSIRLNVEWPKALRSLSKNPMLGTGYSSIGLAVDNDYLRALAETGVLGFLAFGLIFIEFFVLVWKSLPLTSKFSGLDLGIISGFVGGIVGVLINGAFIDVFEASKFAIIFWFMFALSIYTIKRVIYDNKN